VSLTPLLDWNDVAFALNYRIQLSTDSLFGTTAWDTTGVTISQVNVPANKCTGLAKYYWRVNATNAAGTGSWSSVWNFTTVQYLPLNLKVYLEGFWGGTTQVVDTVRIYLANPTSPFAFVDSSKVVLTATGTATTAFTKVLNGSYFLVVIHRNHLETWSANAQVFNTNSAVNYDFTTAATQAFGSNMKQVGSVWVLFGGDPNQDGSIDADDIPIFISQYGLTGYLSCDFNGDNDVNANDVAIIVANFGLTKVIPGMIIDPPEIRKQKQMTKKHELNEMLKQIKNKKEGKIIKAD
jgi:hypothetical protein